jgi:hypothetical protein
MGYTGVEDGWRVAIAPAQSAQIAPAPARCQGQSTRFATRKATTAGPSNQAAGSSRARHTDQTAATYRAIASSSPASPS